MGSEASQSATGRVAGMFAVGILCGSLTYGFLDRVYRQSATLANDRKRRQLRERNHRAGEGHIDFSARGRPPPAAAPIGPTTGAFGRAREQCDIRRDFEAFIEFHVAQVGRPSKVRAAAVEQPIEVRAEIAPPPKLAEVAQDEPQDEPTDSEDLQCCICQVNKSRTALVPCGHAQFCIQCTKQIRASGKQTCPVCRSPVQIFLRTYQ